MAEFIGSLSHITFISIFCLSFDWGYQGIVQAICLMYLFRAAANHCLVVYHGEIEMHNGVWILSDETLTNLGPMMKKGMASMVLGVEGWWSFSFLALLTTYIGASASAAHQIMRNIMLLAFLVP